jgi:hypothetical protein
MRLIVKRERETLICDRCHKRGQITRGEVCDPCRKARKLAEITPARQGSVWTDEYRASVLAAAKTQRKFA